jgi:hypothetical protein
MQSTLSIGGPLLRVWKKRNVVCDKAVEFTIRYMTEIWVKDMNDTSKAKPNTRKNYFRLTHCPLHLPHKLATIETRPGGERPATDHNTQRTAWFRKTKSDNEPPRSKQATRKKRDTRAINVRVLIWLQKQWSNLFCLIAITTLTVERFTKPRHTYWEHVYYNINNRRKTATP